MLRVQSVLVAALMSFAANAQAEKLIAVLPLDVSNTEGKLSKAAQASVEEMLRDVATEALTAGGWTVLSTENQLQLLIDNGVDPAKCGEQNCQLATAREIKAEKFLSGAIQYSDGEFTASVRLIDTATGRILASERLAGKTARDLRTAFEGRSDAFFAKAGLTGTPSRSPVPDTKPGGPNITTDPATAALGTLTISAKPRDAVRLELTDPDGKSTSSGGSYENKQAKPGAWKITARAAGFEDQTQTVDVPVDDVTLVKFELKSLGGLKITGAPTGAGVSVTGPAGFHNEGALPWAGEGLRSGTYKVRVSRAGYADLEQTAEVKSGNKVTLQIELKKTGGTEGMVRIPGGTFNMGAEDGRSDEAPVTRVTLSPYLMDKTEVTVAAYAACVKSGKCTEPSAQDSSCNFNVAGRENHPINCVDWNQARAYCAAQGSRLPTEAEWEFGARGTDGRKFPWGNQDPNPSLALWDAHKHSEPVATHAAGQSPFGLLDMSGSVWEWVEDSFVPYPGGSVTNPKREVEGRPRVARGGGWGDGKTTGLTATYRSRSEPSDGSDQTGFRCAR